MKINSYHTIFNQRNQKIRKNYKKNLNIIKEILSATKKRKDKYSKFSFKIAEWIVLLTNFESTLTNNYFLNNELSDLQHFNNKLFIDIFSQNYETSYSNPQYAVSVFGKNLGTLFCIFYTEFRNYINYAFRHNQYEMNRWNNIFITFYQMIQQDKPNKEDLEKLITKEFQSISVEEKEIETLQKFDPTATNYKSIVMESDLSDLRFLYQYGQNITKNEIHTAKFLLNYSENKIIKLAKCLTKAFIRGFDLSRKDISKKENVNIYYNIGQEIIIKSLINQLEDSGLNPMLLNVFSTNANRQFDYDHRFDIALYFNQDFVDLNIFTLIEASKLHSKLLNKYCGPIYFDKFGEKDFKPQHKEECLKLSIKQQKLMHLYKTIKREIQDTFTPKSEVSFCIVAFPIPQIGKKFNQIFNETFNINMMDSLKYEKIQQNLINAIDNADYIYVKGKGNNKTNIKIKLQKLKDPLKHTNFENCGAHVNVPVGEIFTTPQLMGTQGILHVSKIYLAGLQYIDLILEFKDGYVIDYDCNNFHSKKENKKYIYENLLFSHKTLPLGEFAIGTNTKAYVMAKKYNILPVMPILIVEKMGPHFAIGDTCYCWEENFKVYNPIDNKEITARDNEKTLLRKKDIQKAYTSCHTDITLPYEELDIISAIFPGRKNRDIIKKGRFVVPGTEELNIPLDNWGID